MHSALLQTGIDLPRFTLERALTDWSVAPLPFVLTVWATGLYAAGVVVMRRRGDRWPVGRTVAFAVGMAQAALEASLEHAATRRQFGAVLRDHQAIAHQLADMAVQVEAARLLVYRAASAHDAGSRTTRLSAMAKLFATEAAQRVVDAAVQIHGARALATGQVLEHLYREVRAPRIYEGTSEIQRTIIARELYREREPPGA